MNGYRKMQESEFDKIEFQTKPENCTKHEFAKLYDQATHSDYGCVHCGMKTLTPEQFSSYS